MALAERPLAWPERDDAPAVAPLVLRTKSPSSDHDFTEDDGDEDLTLTGQLFFAGPPELSPF